MGKKGEGRIEFVGGVNSVEVNNNGVDCTECRKRRVDPVLFKSVLTLFLLFIPLFAGLIVAKPSAMDVTLQWDTNEDADYYVVYYGTSSGNYTKTSQNIDAPTIQHTVTGLSQAIWYFSVKAFNSFGNSSDFSDEIAYTPFYSPLSISIESPFLSANIKQGESINFQSLVSGGTSPLVFSWDFGVGGPAGSSMEDPGNVTFDNPGSYTVKFTVTDSNNEVQFVTVFVTVDQIPLDVNPTVEISSPAVNVTTTAGSSIQFEGLITNGNAPFTYYWNFGSAEIPDSSVEDPGSVVFPKAGEYIVKFTVSDNDGDITTDTITVTVDERIIDVEPVASISSPELTVMITQGGFIDFNGTVSSGNAPLTHSWDFDSSGIPLSNEEDPGRIMFSKTGTYTVTYTVTDDDGDVSRDTVVVTVLVPDINPIADISGPSSNVTITQGGSVSFQATVINGNAPYTHAWNFGSSGVTARTVEDPGTLTFSSVGIYNVIYTVTDSDGDVSSSARTVTVVEPDTNPTAVISSPESSVTIVQSGSVDFQSTVTGGNAPYTHSWNFGSSGIDRKTVEDPGRLVFASSGVFTVTYTATDMDGDVSSVIRTVTVLVPDTKPTASMTGPSSNVTITQGGSVNFQATVTSGNGPYIHLWNFGTSGVAARSVEDPGSLTFNTIGTHNVTYTVTDKDGDTSSVTRTVTVTAPDTNPTTSITSPLSNVSITQGGIVNFQVTVSNGNAPFSHKWNFGTSGIASQNVEDPGGLTFSKVGAHTVTYTVTDNDGDTSSATRTVTVNAPDTNPTAVMNSPSDNTTITQGGSVIFAATVTSGNSPFTHAWNFGTSGISGQTVEDPGNLTFNTIGTHTVTYTVTDSDGDTNSATRTVTVNALDTNPTAVMNSPSDNTTITQGGTVNFAATVTSGNAPFTHAWNFGTSGIGGQAVEDPGILTFNTIGTHTVTYTVTDSDGDTNSATRKVTVNAPDSKPTAAIIGPSDNTTITQGGTVNFAATVTSGNAPFTHAWNFGTSGIAGQTVEDPGSLTFNTIGTHTVTYTVTDLNGDTHSAIRLVTVTALDTHPTAVITSPSVNMTITQGDSVSFGATVTGGNAPYSYEWNFSVSGIANKTVEDPGSLVFNKVGSYTVTYKVTDNDGDINSATRTVTVEASAVTNPTVDIINQGADPSLIMYTLVSTTNPGEKSTDNFIPLTEKSIVESEGDKPTIDVRDAQLKHLLWLKCGWANYNKINGDSHIAAGDLNGDGKDELILGLSSENATPTMPSGFFQVLDDTYAHMGWGRVEWADYNEINGETWPTCGDVDGDGKDEIIVGLGKNGSGYVEIFSLENGMIVHKNWIRLQWPDYNEINGEVRPVCADVNGDGIDDIIAGLGSIGGDTTIPGGKFEVFSKVSGEWVHLLWGFVDWPEYTEINGETWPAAGDVDGDGDVELVVGLGQGGEGQMAVFEFSNGEALQSDWVQIQWPEYNDVFGETRPICGDVDNDGKDEVILGWSTSAKGDESSHYFKVLSFNTTSRSWVNYRDTKSAPVVDINSMPVKGSVDKDSRIYIGISSDEEKLITPQVQNVTGGGGGSSGCFINSASE